MKSLTTIFMILALAILEAAIVAAKTTSTTTATTIITVEVFGASTSVTTVADMVPVTSTTVPFPEASTSQTTLRTSKVHAVVAVQTEAVPTATPVALPSNEQVPGWGPKYITMVYENRMDEAIQLSPRSASGQDPLPGYPQPGVLEPSKTSTLVVPTGMGVNMAFGSSVLGSTVEMNRARPQAHIDVSFVEGYTLPIVCSVKGSLPLTGCNLDLWEYAANVTRAPCPDTQPWGCKNTGRFVNGPALAFFAPCSGAAYTYDRDNRANQGCNGAEEFHCCVGTKCPAVDRQPAHRDQN